MASSRLTKISLCLGLLFLQVNTAEARPQEQSEWPKLIGKSTPECKQVLAAARMLFNGDSAELLSNLKPLTNSKTGALLALSGRAAFVEGSGENETWFDPKYIKTDRPASENPSQFEQKDIQNGSRFLVTSQEHSWRGYVYSLYCANAQIPTDKIDLATGQEELKKTDDGYIIYQALWHQPLLFRNAKTKKIVAVNTQADWLKSAGERKNQVIFDWKIYEATGPGQVKEIGTIKFASKGDAFQILPKGPLRKMGMLLDEIIGVPSGNEGTLQSTLHQHGNAQLALANLILRPWGLGKPDNTRKEVDQGLKSWSKGSPIYRKQFEELKSLYPQALDALSVHYQKAFKLNQKEARSLATKYLDIAFRKCFRF
ncbi:MAG: hypothetical protein K2Y32_11240 [Candidatus Obscuribacterales bacterium]|nr:hypothetical protein [Candidatus Obscuribacterales bacterium]